MNVIDHPQEHILYTNGYQSFYPWIHELWHNEHTSSKMWQFSKHSPSAESGKDDIVAVMASGLGRDVWRDNSPDSLLDLATRLPHIPFSNNLHIAQSFQTSQSTVHPSPPHPAHILPLLPFIANDQVLHPPATCFHTTTPLRLPHSSGDIKLLLDLGTMTVD